MCLSAWSMFWLALFSTICICSLFSLIESLIKMALITRAINKFVKLCADGKTTKGELEKFFEEFK